MKLALRQTARSPGFTLTTVGHYDLLTLQVARHTREFGVRSALDANAVQLIAPVTTQAARLLTFGLLLGTAGAWAGVRWLELHTLSPASFPAVTAIFALATWLPAQRAARIDPMIALRAE